MRAELSLTLARVLSVTLMFQAMSSLASPLSESASVPWRKDFTLTEYMKVYDFPEQQVNYPVQIPAGIKAENLTLLSVMGSSDRAVPFQLSQDAKGGTVLSFRTDLPAGGKRMFRLVSGGAARSMPVTVPEPPVLQVGADGREGVWGNGLLLVKVPTGKEEFGGGKPFSQAAAPILGLARKGQPWVASGSISAPSTVLVESVEGKMVESGPLFAKYQVAYKLQGEKSYLATLELRANEPFVRVAEEVHGLAPADEAFLRLDYGQGLLDPDRRLAAGNGGYFPHSYAPFTGRYDDSVSTNCKFVPWQSTAGWWEYDPAKDDSKDPRLNYCLSIYAPNQIAVTQATAFYREKGTDALLLSLYRLADWKTHQRAIWTSVRATESLRFYSRSQDGAKYMTAGLTGAARYWVVGLVPRAAVTIAAVPGDSVPAPAAGGKARKKVKAPEGGEDGPESQLFVQLNQWSLDAYKDRAAAWPETFATAPFDRPDYYVFTTKGNFEPIPYRGMSYEDYDARWRSGSAGRQAPGRYGAYALNRASWTQEQRDRARQFLLFFADAAEGDVLQPSHSMLAGHPNFLMDAKSALPIACATFPDHPRAKVWRDSFMNCYNEWLDTYIRKDVPELNTKGGRWTENIACYVGQCYTDLEAAQICLKAYDGTSLGQNPQLLSLIRWMRDSFMSPHDGLRRVPPEGAHANAFDHPGGQGMWDTFFKLCSELAPDDPKLAKEMRWIETNGKEGQKPDLHSGLYTDYGPVFRYDFGGEHESYAHMQNIYGFLRYRWAHGGIVFYGAKGKQWSYNTMEANGDEFDWNQVTAFTVNGKGMDATPTDQLLYDFDFAQFYRELAKGDEAYRARGVMLLRDDYLVVSDEVQDAATAGTFHWVTLFDPPQIYQLKPGASVLETVASDKERADSKEGTRHVKGKVFSYSGKGDFLTVVAPAAVKAQARPFGASVNGEYVFASQKPQEVSQGTAVFSGTYGYARPNQLALFQGTRIGLNGFELRRDGGDFGLSAAVEGNRIVGRMVGRSGGKVFVVPPQGTDLAKAVVTIDGKPVPHTLEQGAIAFSVEIAQRDGLKGYQIQFGK